QYRRPATARSSACSTTSSRPVSRSRKRTLRRRAPYAESGRSIAEPIDAPSADTRHPAMSWVALISAPSESRAACGRVVAYRTQSNLCILQSILAHRQVVPGTPGKLLGSNSEKLQGFSPRRVSQLLPRLLGSRMVSCQLHEGHLSTGHWQRNFVP